jgi:glucose/arabinose dehydrogenase
MHTPHCRLTPFPAASGRLARRSIELMMAALILAMAGLLSSWGSADASSLEPGFAESVVVSGLDGPTQIATLPDGRVLVAEQGGRLRLVKNGALVTTPVLSVTVNRTAEAGFDGVVADPNFASNGYIYVYYTATTPNAHNRISRFTMVGDTASAASEFVLLDLEDLTAFQHVGGAMRFGQDGKLYVGVGDNYTAANAQDMSTIKGKLLRLNADGSVPADNPFLSTTTGKARYIWALGLRNPYTLDVQRGTGRIFISDVGETSWEEINDGLAGANYGWPTTEGYTSDARFESPLYAYPHTADDSGGCAIVGGAFYNPVTSQFPTQYVGRYFFADFCNQWIKSYDPVSGDVANFATALAGEALTPAVANDGTMYYLNRTGTGNGGELRRIIYTGSLGPSIGSEPEDQLVSVGYPATFTVEASGNDPLTYQWMHNGATIPGATAPTYTTPPLGLSNDGDEYHVTVTNGFGQATSRHAVVTMTEDEPPTASIDTPPSGTLWSAGQTISFSGSASDAEDGVLAPAAYTWRVDFGHHASGTPSAHVHPFVAPFSGASGGSFVIPTVGETAPDVYYRIILTVHDSVGLTSTITRDIFPTTANVTLATNPSGLLVGLDGTPHNSPYSFTGVAGIERQLDAPSPQAVNGTLWAFSGWSDGGARTHTISTPSSDSTFTATFTAVPPSIVASPNPIQVCDGSGLGVSTLTWTSGTTVQVRIDSPTGAVFGSSPPGTSSNTTGKWVYEGRTFYLQDISSGTPGTTLASVAVHVTQQGCAPTGSLSASPNPIQVCDGSGLGVTTLTWSSSGATTVEVHLDSPSGPRFAVTGQGTFSRATGKWVYEGRTLYLQDISSGTPGTTLASVAVHVTQQGCAATGSLSASPNPIQVCDGSGLGVTTMTWSSSGATTVEVHLDSPSGPTFAVTGPGTFNYPTGKWVYEGRTLYLQNVSSGSPGTTLASTVVHLTTQGCWSLSASPNPIQVCSGSTGVTTLTWSSTGASTVEVHLDSPSGPRFAVTGPGTFSRATGNWVYEGRTFYLQNVSSGVPGTTLASTTVHLTQQGCPVNGSLSADPNPIQVCDGSGLGVSTLTWTTSGTTSVEVHIDSPTGPTFAVTGSGTSSNTTGKWVYEGRTFYLQNVSSGAPGTTLASTVVYLTTQGC